MKVLLIQPPVQDFYDTDMRLQPIGLCYLKASIRKHLPEVEVIIKDYHSGHGRRTVAIPGELSYLREYYPVADRSPFSTFHHYYHFGQSFDNIEAEIEDIRPDVVGISSLFTPYYREALETARRVKNRLTVPVIMGGSHVSEVPESVLSNACVDYIVQGEGEKPMVAFLLFLLGHIKREDVPNLGYKKGGRLYFNHVNENYPVDDLPVPDLSDFSKDRYTIKGNPVACVITSRGCPQKCSFCSVHTIFGDTHRLRSVDSVINEIGHRYREGYRVIDFEDDNLTFHKIRSKELCRRLIEKFPAKEMEYVAMNGISYMSLDDELLELMVQAGFTQLNLALVSRDKKVLDSMNRPHSPDAYVKVVTKAFALGFKIVSYQILGLPGERVSGMIKTLAFNARLPVLIGLSPFYCTPGAPVARGMNVTKADYLKARLTALSGDAGSCQREDIYTLLIIARIINFLKGLDIAGSTDINQLINQSWKDRRVMTGFELLKGIRQRGVLSFRTSRETVDNRKFKTELFERFVRETEYITCQNGNNITMSNFLNMREDLETS